MLISIHVKNLALIEEVELDLEKGLNILTGETGAGKSILIGSLNLALGAKGDKEFIRKGAEFGLVELTFSSKQKKIMDKLEELELPILEDNTIMISRRIQPNRSVSRINGEVVTLKQVKEIAKELIDIHGQHEHQSLLSKNKHLEILDFYGKEALATLQEEFRKYYKEWKAISKQLKEEMVDEEAKNREIDFLKFEIEEIQSSHLVEGEDIEIEANYDRLSNQTKIQEALSLAYGYSGAEDGNGAMAQIERALREIRPVISYDFEIETIASGLEQVEDILKELNRGMQNFIEVDSFDQEQFYKMEQRINEINRLKDKYGQQISDILAYEIKSSEKLEKLQDFDTYIENLMNQQKQLQEKVVTLGDKISKRRKEIALLLEEQLIAILSDLNFPQIQFEIKVEKKEEISSLGYDEVEFMISTNPGEKLKPLSQVASGGELSRIMLGIKTVLNQQDEIETMIFDEIDTGISGKTAWKVSEKLSALGTNKQVICITHLPQIAANADTHFFIEKTSDLQSTETKITSLSEQEMLEELARMLGADQLSQAALDNAIELKKKAGKI